MKLFNYDTVLFLSNLSFMNDLLSILPAGWLTLPAKGRYWLVSFPITHFTNKGSQLANRLTGQATFQSLCLNIKNYRTMILKKTHHEVIVMRFEACKLNYAPR